MLLKPRNHDQPKRLNIAAAAAAYPTPAFESHQSRVETHQKQQKCLIIAAAYRVPAFESHGSDPANISCPRGYKTAV